MQEVVADPTRRRAVIDDCVRLVDDEVADKKGISGMAVKAAFKTIKRFKPGIVPMAFNGLIDDFAKKIDPIWIECQASGQEPRAFFQARQADIADALLSVTDERARLSKHKTLVKAYQSLRPKAVQHIGAAMPRFADLVGKHTA